MLIQSKNMCDKQSIKPAFLIQYATIPAIYFIYSDRLATSALSSWVATGGSDSAGAAVSGSVRGGSCLKFQKGKRKLDHKY